MKVSKMQTEVWRVREELSRKLAKMTPEERREYLSGAIERAEAVLGQKLNLPTVGPVRPQSGPRNAR